MEPNNQLKILSIVSTSYTTFKGEQSNDGLFVILDINQSSRTAIGAKLTSNLQITSANVVFVPQVDCPCLRTNSLLYLDHLHTLDITRCNQIGVIRNQEICNNIYRQIKNVAFKFVNNIKDIDEVRTHTTYVSPNKMHLYK
jgi:hypothetical protein